MNNIWNALNEARNEFTERGFIKLPPLPDAIDLNKYADEIVNEVGNNTFTESSPVHAKLLDALEVRSVLAPILFDIAREKFGYGGEMSDQYHIARLVQPGNSTEQYRAHFDSHLFTLVIPLMIPTAVSPGEEVGELLFRPNARRNPRSELENLAGKIYSKKYANRESALKLLRQNKFEVEDFSDRRPILFMGRTTLHTNKAVGADASSARLTLLAHFFDPSPKFGVGKILRTVRRRHALQP